MTSTPRDHRAVQNRLDLPPALAQTLMIACGFAGGWLVTRAGVPAGWLSGAMFASAALAASGVATPFSNFVRRAAFTGSGVAIGSAITPAMLRGLATYPVTLLLMALAVAAVTAAGAVLLARQPGWNRETAFFASMPGALSYVFALAAETKGADVPRIAVVQVMRVFLLMGIVPLVVAESGAPLAPPSTATIDSLPVLALLVALGVALGLVLERRKVAAGMMFGAMIVAGVAHATGLAPGRPPPAFTVAAQVLIGVWVGARFIGFDWRLFGRSILASFGSFLVAMAVSGACAVLAHAIVGVGFAQALVAFAPGGLEAMSLLSIALGLDPLFVSAHHLARFLFISLVLPFVLRRWILASRDDGRRRIA